MHELVRFFTSNTTHKHQFGRGINANIAPNEEELFEKSYEAFESKDILDAYEYFLKSLENFSNDESNKNIITSRGPATAICFALEIVRELVGEDTYKEIKGGLLADYC